jgi:hypothetical protein
VQKEGSETPSSDSKDIPIQNMKHFEEENKEFVTNMIIWFAHLRTPLSSGSMCGPLSADP